MKFCYSYKIVRMSKAEILAQQHLGTILRGVLTKMQQVTEGNVMQVLYQNVMCI